MVCYATSVLEDRATKSDIALDYADKLLEGMYSWDMKDVNILLDMIESYHGEMDWYFDNHLILIPMIDYTQIPSYSKDGFEDLDSSNIIAVDSFNRIGYTGNGIEYITDYEVVS